MPFSQGWGCGLQLVLEDLPGMRRSGTGNWAGLMNSYYWIDPVKDVTGVMATQVFPFADIEAFPLFKELESAVYASI